MKHDFKKILAFLVATGMTYRDVGRAIGTTGPTISRIAKGQIPRHDHGEAILVFYRKRKEEIANLMSE